MFKPDDIKSEPMSVDPTPGIEELNPPQNPLPVLNAPTPPTGTSDVSSPPTGQSSTPTTEAGSLTNPSPASQPSISGPPTPQLAPLANVPTPPTGTSSVPSPQPAVPSTPTVQPVSVGPSITQAAPAIIPQVGSPSVPSPVLQAPATPPMTHILRPPVNPMPPTIRQPVAQAARQMASNNVTFSIPPVHLPVHSESSGSTPEPASRPRQPLAEFSQQLEDYMSTIPDAVTMHYMRSAGFEAADPRIVRLISIAAQKFLSDVANDALQHCKTRTSAQQNKSSKNKDKKFTLTMEDLSPALSEYGIVIRKPPYFV